MHFPPSLNQATFDWLPHDPRNEVSHHGVNGITIPRES